MVYIYARDYGLQKGVSSDHDVKRANIPTERI